MDKMDLANDPGASSGGEPKARAIRPEITAEELAALEMPIPLQQESGAQEPIPAPNGGRDYSEQPATEQTHAPVYVPRDTQEQVNRALFEDAGGRSLADLVEELLREWLSRRKAR